jgi:hypothetical protein
MHGKGYVIRQKLEEYEAAFVDDPDRLEHPVVCIRKADVIPAAMEMVWGAEWRSFNHDRPCMLCRETVIVRDLFKDNPLVCHVCAPAFLAVVNKETPDA